MGQEDDCLDVHVRAPSLACRFRMVASTPAMTERRRGKKKRNYSAGNRDQRRKEERERERERHIPTFPLAYRTSTGFSTDPAPDDDFPLFSAISHVCRADRVRINR